MLLRDNVRDIGFRLRVTLEGTATHPLVALFEEFIFQNLPVSFFGVHF